MTLLHHGGRLAQAINQYAIPRTQWLDLSSGVSPWHYPVADIDSSYWNRLPEEEDGLEQTARQYYGCNSLLAVAGSQAAIQQLPFIYKAQQQQQQKQQEQRGIAGLPLVGYKEHQKAWQKAGFRIEHYHNTPTAEQLARWQILVVINPNNPTAKLFSQQQLLNFKAQLDGGLLVVDEAFADIDESQSVTHLCPMVNVVVLRSIGKFFGLAGVRVGFVLAQSQWLEALAIELGPWTIAGPSRQLCQQALMDKTWQQQQRLRLLASSQRLQQVLQPYSSTAVAGTGLFQTLTLTQAATWHHLLCQQGIFTRLTDERDALRFGLPANEQQWQRLTQALQATAQQAIAMAQQIAMPQQITVTLR